MTTETQVMTISKTELRKHMRIESVRLWNVECKVPGCYWSDGTDSKANAEALAREHMGKAHKAMGTPVRAGDNTVLLHESPVCPRCKADIEHFIDYRASASDRDMSHYRCKCRHRSRWEALYDGSGPVALKRV